MSRQTGECFAEVTFETQKGCFRCHWSQRRAHKKSYGELQPPKHEIANAESGEIFESKISGVADQIEAATGMDFDRFTRSMLLAQGGFAAFLQAAPDERAPILEQITGMEIYTQISMRVHKRHNEEREKLNSLQSQITGIMILEPDKENEIQCELDSKQKEEIDISTKSADTRKYILWLNAIDSLKKDILSLSEEGIKLQNEINAFNPNRDKLNRALSAALLDGSYATLTAIRKQQMLDQNALTVEEMSFSKLESSDKAHAESLRLSEQLVLKTKDELKISSPIIQKVRFLDNKLADQKKAILDGEESVQKDATNINKNKQTINEEQNKRSEAQRNLGYIEGYLKEHIQDEWLISGLTGVEEQLNSLVSKQKEITKKESLQKKAVEVLEQASKSFDDCQKQSRIRKQELDDILKRLQQNKDVLNHLLGNRLLREYRTEKETLLREMTFLTKIAKLEDLRVELEDGKPCPLCGAKEHPFAEGNVPVPDEVEHKIEALNKLIRKAEDQETVIKKLEESEIIVRQKLTNSEKQETSADNDKKVATKDLDEVNEILKKIRTDYSEYKQIVSDKLAKFDIKKIPDNGVSSLLESLRARLNAWQDKVKKKAELEKQIACFDGEIKRLDSVIETQNKALAEKNARIESLKKAYAEGNDERDALYGNKSPDDVENNLNKAVSDAESKEKKARNLHNELQQKLNTIKANVESLKKRINDREPELRKYQIDFFETLKIKDFSDEEQFLKARLTAEQRDSLAAKSKELNDSQTDLKARRKDREARLENEMDRKLTDKSLNELEPQFKEYEDSLKTLRNNIASLKHKLNENTSAKERIKEKQTVIESQKKECRRWENLHELIGSADGKKYRNFAQGLTFEMMIRHANRQLQKMTERYLLILDENQPLELNVVDNYQAGEIRSTKNLSGGESFIVSLSLALGLSHMASKNVRVDSLFLDEGFGTLDEEALETALETLASLQQDGKLIGVISHVPALQERISTQIKVTPLTGGRSQILGPGCVKVSDTEQTLEEGVN